MFPQQIQVDPSTHPNNQTQAQSAADHVSAALDEIRQAIQAPDSDPQEKLVLSKVTTLLAQFAATRHTQQQAALGGGPATQFLSRATGGG